MTIERFINMNTSLSPPLESQSSLSKQKDDMKNKETLCENHHHQQQHQHLLHPHPHHHHHQSINNHNQHTTANTDVAQNKLRKTRNLSLSSATTSSSTSTNNRNTNRTLSQSEQTDLINHKTHRTTTTSAASSASTSSTNSLRRHSSICLADNSKLNENKSSKNNKTNLNYFHKLNNSIRTHIILNRTHFVTFALILFISILTNSVYFNFYYLPALTELNAPTSSGSGSKQSGSDNKFNNKIHSIPPYFSSVSYEHVVFPSLGNEENTNKNANNKKSEDNNEDSKYSLMNKDTQIDDLDLLNEQLLVGLYQIEEETIKEKRKKKQREAQMALSLALNMQNEGKFEKAAKIYQYALNLDPKNPDALTSYGEYLELHKKDIIKAEHFYTKVLNMQPKHGKALINLKRTLPLVTKIDRLMLDRLDMLLKKFYDIPSTSGALKRAKKEAYFMHIYHSNAIEGNTLNLQQTRHIVENRMAINGKSLLEHQEVLGLDAAMRFINETLLYRKIGQLTINDILEIHRRVLGFCDPIESGKFRQHQVFVGHFVPPSADLVERLMAEFIEWLNSNQLLTEAHPVQIAALAHYKFVYIHPFYDGNGRTARLLMNLILMRSGYPPILIKKEERLEYYEYLEMANQGDVKPFIRFIAKCTQRTLEEYIRICNNSHGISVDNESKMIRSDLIINNLNKHDKYLFSGRLFDELDDDLDQENENENNKIETNLETKSTSNELTVHHNNEINFDLLASNHKSNEKAIITDSNQFKLVNLDNET